MFNYGVNEFQSDSILLSKKISDSSKQYEGLYGVPRGGIPLAISLSHLLSIPMVTDLNTTKNILIVDDLVDSGRTRLRFPHNDYATIHIKKRTPKECWPTYFVRLEGDWITYFWERGEKTSSEELVVRLFENIGEDPNRDGLLDTPKRFDRSIKYLTSGYDVDIKSVFTIFEESCDQIVILKDIEFYSLCEHHLLPFFGKVTLAYVPRDNKIIGTSKLARLVDIFSRRLQIQERMGEQITNTLIEFLNPIGAACVIKAQHMCMLMRGVQKQNSVMITSSIKGVFLDSVKLRAEFMDLIKL